MTDQDRPARIRRPSTDIPDIYVRLLNRDVRIEYSVTPHISKEADFVVTHSNVVFWLFSDFPIVLVGFNA